MPHLCKTIHLSLSPNGSAIVSEGVFADLKLAGMPDLDVVGEVKQPPKIVVGGRETRAQQDHKAYAQRVWTG